MIKQIEWNDIEGYEGLYQVSETGSVRSKDRIINTIDGKSYWRGSTLLKPKNHKDGYRFVLLCKSLERKNHYIHRLVAKAFIPNPHDKPQVNHINGIKDDNRLENLEWVTQSENAAHACKTGLCFNIADLNHKGHTVVDTETGTRYPSINKAAKAKGLTYCTMRRRLNGRSINTTSLVLVKE